MNLQQIRKYFSTSLRRIRQLEYKSKNLQMLSKVLEIEPNKNKLQHLMNTQLNEICPCIQESKLAFAKRQQQVKGLYKMIKGQILVENDEQLDHDFYQRAHYYFQKQGKKIRPLMIVMLAENFKKTILRSYPDTDFKQLDHDILKWGALIQIMHIASLAHDDIVDDSPSRRGQQSQHLKYGSRVAVFSGNYVISKASKTVGEFNSSRLYEIYAHTMASLAQGQIKQLLAKKQNKFVNQSLQKKLQFQQMMQRYMQKTYFKSAALMCGSLLGVPTIFQLHFGSKFTDSIGKHFNFIQQSSFRLGQHYGLSLQLIDDILDYVSTSSEMGKEAMSDLIQGNVTAPVYFTYLYQKYIKESGEGVSLDMLNKRHKDKNNALAVKQWVENGVGIEMTYLLGGMHVLEGLKQLQSIISIGQNQQSEQQLSWRYLGYKLMTRRN